METIADNRRTELAKELNKPETRAKIEAVRPIIRWIISEAQNEMLIELESTDINNLERGLIQVANRVQALAWVNELLAILVAPKDKVQKLDQMMDEAAVSAGMKAQRKAQMQ